MVCTLGLWRGTVQPYSIPVIDVSNLLENTIQTIEQILMVVMWGIDLAAIADGAEGGGAGYNDDLAALASLAADARGLAWDIESLETQWKGLFSLEATPNSSKALWERSTRVRALLTESYGYAMKTQTLIQTTQHTVQHLVKITQKIAAVLGGVSGHQNGQEYLARLTQLQAQQQVTVTAFQRAQATREADEPIVLEGIERIKLDVRADWPK